MVRSAWRVWRKMALEGMLTQRWVRKGVVMAE